MTPTQIEEFRASIGVAAGDEWEPWAGLSDNLAAQAKALAEKCQIARQKHALTASRFDVPTIVPPAGEENSTQAAFGKILLELSKQGGPLASRIVTTSPDVTVSTNLGAWVNQRGLFRRSEMADVFRAARIPSAQKWAGNGAGQHIELGIAENNLFLNLAALGLSGALFGERLIPIGTVYDPFISRGLDALNYACYQDARFILVATPSGVTLGPEGGAHQSINPPLIAMGQPGLRHYEPAFADELAVLMEESFRCMQADDGESVYLRLTTRTIAQPARPDESWKEGAIQGGYWLRQPTAGAEAAIAFSGSIAPEAIAAYEAMLDDLPGLGLLNITSPALLHRGWTAALNSGHDGGGRNAAIIETLLAPLAPNAKLVTIIDAAPATLSWLGGVRGQRVYPLGTELFGQTGDLPDLYRHHRIDKDAVIDAVARLLLDDWQTA